MKAETGPGTKGFVPGSVSLPGACIPVPDVSEAKAHVGSTGRKPPSLRLGSLSRHRVVASAVR